MSTASLPSMGSLLFSPGPGPLAGPAAQAVTGTVTVAPTAAQAATSTVVAPATAGQAVTRTVVVVPTPGSVLTPPIGANSIPQGQIANPFSPDYQGQAAQPGPGLFSWLFLLLSLIMLGAGIYYYFVGKNRWRRVHRLNYRLANFWSLVAMSLGGLGVLFMIFRFFNVDGLNARFWLYLMLLIMIGFAGYGLYYLRMRYPAQLAAFQKTQKGRAVAPARARNTAPRAAANPAAPPRPGGTPGNPRGTSARGDRRREKKR